ncbi:hypothetical protein SB767_29445, partial [Bacillus sp. SIMBA_069]
RMIRTLYLRLVLTFLAVILIAIISSSLISLAVYEKELDELQRSEMTSIGENIIRIYEQSKYPELNSFARNMEALTANPVLLFNDVGKLITDDKGLHTIPQDAI